MTRHHDVRHAEGRTPLFVADWTDVIFVHYRITDDATLQRVVPFELDRFAGAAYVSLVAFTQRRLRPTFGGRLTAFLSAPLASHEFLNVRTYVRHDGANAIFFLAEWIPNRLAAWIGPRTYGLPYRLGKLDYEHFTRRVRASDRELLIRIDITHSDSLQREMGVASVDTPLSSTCNRTLPRRAIEARLPEVAPGSLDEFLLERYTAFTHRAGVTRRFDVQHVPWPQTRVEATVTESSLLELTGDWSRGADVVAANYSPGVRDVRMTPPARLTAQPRRGATSRWSPA